MNTSSWQQSVPHSSPQISEPMCVREIVISLVHLLDSTADFKVKAKAKLTLICKLREKSFQCWNLAFLPELAKGAFALATLFSANNIIE